MIVAVGGSGSAAPPNPEWGIQLVALRDTTLENGPYWVVEFDPDAGPAESFPTGEILTSNKPESALRFGSTLEAMEFARQQSTRIPFRPDGEPNRPMTIFTIVIRQIPRKERR